MYGATWWNLPSYRATVPVSIPSTIPRCREVKASAQAMVTGALGLELVTVIEEALEVKLH